MLTVVCLGCSFFLVGNVWAKKITLNPKNMEYFEQVYLRNEYILEQLQTLARAVNKPPRRVGKLLEKVNISLLVLKLNSLNYLIRKDFQPYLEKSYQPLDQQLKLDGYSLLQQSNQMLQFLPELFRNHQLLPPIDFNDYSAVSWHTEPVTSEKLYQQFLHIGSLLIGLSGDIKQKNIYDVMYSTQALLLENCDTQQEIIVSPSTMDKRPEDVHLHLLEYIALLSNHTPIDSYPDGAVNIYPSDVYDLAMFSLAYSLELISDEEYVLISNRLKVDMPPHVPVPRNASIITPSHTYQTVSENIALLECEARVNR